MARMPCSVGPHYTPFKNRLGYVHLWGPGIAWNRRIRLCRGHAPAVQEDLAQFKWDPTNLTTSAGSPPTDCVSCLKPVDEAGLHLSITYYPADDQREDYWARLHLDCGLPACLEGGEELA